MMTPFVLTITFIIGGYNTIFNNFLNGLNLYSLIIREISNETEEDK